MPDIGEALRTQVRDRAKRRCEYCLVPDTLTFLEHEIDHILAVKHGGQTSPENLAWCCTLCNRHKGSDIASIDRQTDRMEPLFHPRRDRWRDHFELRGGEIVPRTAVGRVTVRLLRLNQPERVKERERMLRANLLQW